jgi:hypothetical protein
MEGHMSSHARRALMRRWWLAIIFVIFMLAVDGEVSRSEALDRWAGTAQVSAGGLSAPFDFIVLVNPGVGASWEWKFLGVSIMSGPLAATVNGSKVEGTAFVTGGAAFTPGIPPCNFTGTIAGNRVDGAFDPVSCGGTGTFFLIKQ